MSWWDDTWANVGYTLVEDTWAGRGASWVWNNGQDVARITFGVFDVAVGIGIFWTGAGTLPGVALMAIGIDQILTGSLNIRYGRVGKNFSVLEDWVYQGTGNETAAILAPGVLSLGVGTLGSAGRLGARMGALGGTLDFAGSILGPAVRLAGTGGELYGAEGLQKLALYLARRKVKLEVGSSRLPTGYDGLFRTHLYGTATLLLKAGSCV